MRQEENSIKSVSRRWRKVRTSKADRIQMLKSLGERIRIMRLQRGLTQQDLAEKARLSNGTVCDLEQGKQINPTVATMAAIAKAMNLPVGVLLDDAQYATFLDFLDYLPEELKQFVLKQENIPWMKLAIRFKDLNVTPELVEKVVHIVGTVKEAEEK